MKTTLAPKVSVSLAIFAACCAAAITIANVNDKLKGLNWAIIPLFVIAGIALLYAIGAAFFSRHLEQPKPPPPETKNEVPAQPLTERTSELAKELFAFLQKQGTKPPTPLSVKGSPEEQGRAFNAYFGWQGKVYRHYMAYYRDRVVQIDRELAAHDVFTKLDMQEIDPPETKGQVDVRKIAEVLLVGAHQLPCSKEQNGALVFKQNLEITLEAVRRGIPSFSTGKVFMKVRTFTSCELNIKQISVAVTIRSKCYTPEPIHNLQDWVLCEQFIDEHKRLNDRRLPLQPLSLLDEIENGPYREGHHPSKWIGCSIPLSYIDQKEIEEVSIKFHDKNGVAGAVTVRDWPESTDRIVEREWLGVA